MKARRKRKLLARKTRSGWDPINVAVKMRKKGVSWGWRRKLPDLCYHLVFPLAGSGCSSVGPRR